MVLVINCWRQLFNRWFYYWFLVIRSVFTKQLEKNPPINRDMIRAMFMQMGRKPSEKDITRVMNSMNQYK